MIVFFWMSMVMVILMVLGFFWNGLTLQMIVSESVIILGILIARKIFRGRIHASVIHGLWGLLVLRLFLVIPAFFVGTGAMPNCSWSVDRVADAVISSVANLEQRDGDVWKDMGEEPVRFDLTQVEISTWLQIIWLAGTAVFCLVFSFLNEHFRRKLFDTRVKVEVPDCPYPVYMVPDAESQTASVPCVARVRREKAIYLSEEVAKDKEKRKYVIAHEISHLKHHDLFWAWVRNFILAFFWFNPLMWVAAILSKRDNEMACDERAIERLRISEGRRYGEVLIDLVDTTNRKDDVFYLATTMTAGKKELRQRIRAIAAGQHNGVVSCLLALVISGVLVGVGFTSYISSAPLTAEQTIQHFYYYEAKENAHGMEKMYPEGGGNSFFNGRGIERGSVVDVVKINDVTGQDVKAFENPPYLMSYADCKVYQTEVVREIAPQRQKTATEYFIVVREEEGDSWKIENWSEGYWQGKW